MVLPPMVTSNLRKEAFCRLSAGRGPTLLLRARTSPHRAVSERNSFSQETAANYFL